MPNKYNFVYADRCSMNATHALVDKVRNSNHKSQKDADTQVI